ncbi:MAG: VOC family protein [Gammaproteobacteria bacterium]|jgi:catechol 2,3-dioxygenase-like lactoylglutathione lyase family enzyme|nr:VOC family protein [Gammaproteobacteria bacterium]
MLQIAGLDHVVIRAMNAETMCRFYCDVLGCTVERDLGDTLGLVQLRAGDALIDIVAVESELGKSGGKGPGREGRNMDHFCVRIDSFDEAAIKSHLAAHHVLAGPTEQRYGAQGYGPSIYISDPEGNTVELKGPPSENST